MEDDPEPEFRQLPLKEVEDKIRRRLASPLAIEKMQESIGNAEPEIGDFRYLYQRWKNPSPTETPEEPAPFEAEKFAEQFGLNYKETGLLDFLELSKTKIGEVQIPTQINFGGQVFQIPRPLSAVLYEGYNKLTLFAARKVDGADGSVYLYWVKESKDSYVPEFSEVKDELTAFWKKKKAFEKASKDAEAIVKDLAGGGKLSEKFPEKSKPTGEFSWFNTLGAIKIGGTAELEGADNDLMKKIFALQNDELDFGPNQSYEKIYVVQMLNQGDSGEELVKQYFDDQFFKIKRLPADVSEASDYYSTSYINDWFTEVEKQFNFKRVD